MNIEQLIEKTAALGSLAITGMAKNAGKTECFNFILNCLRQKGVRPSVTSIGIDGENKDIVKNTAKPEITLYPGERFVTTESFYRSRKMVSEILEINQGSTSLGRLVTGKVINPGKIILSGPPDVSSLKELIKKLEKDATGPVIIDGALSRQSLGAPAITEAMILATGAVISPSLKEVVKKTAFVCKMIDLPVVDIETFEILDSLQNGVWLHKGPSELLDLELPSALSIEKLRQKLLETAEVENPVLFIGGAVTDSVLDALADIFRKTRLRLIVRDFTCLFLTEIKYKNFVARGHEINVLKKPNLLTVTVNPISPDGYRLNSDEMREKITEATGYPAIDVFSSNDFKGKFVNQAV